MNLQIGIGEIAAFGTAGLWAVSSLLYGRTELSAWGINIAKNSIATIALIVQVAICWCIWSEYNICDSPSAFAWLAASGLVGILIGDTLYFRSIQILGPRRALIIATFSPLFSALLGWLVLDQMLHILNWVGILTTSLAISWVVAERQTKQESPGLFPGTEFNGMLAGIGAAICQAVGAIAAVKGMENCDPIQGSLIRIAAALVSASLISLFAGNLWSIVKRIIKKDNVRKLLPAALLGAWLGIWLSLVAFDNSPVAIASTLLATSPLYSLPLVAIFLKQRVSIRAVAGTILALIGIGLTIYKFVS